MSDFRYFDFDIEGIPLRYFDCTLDDFEPRTAKQRAALQTLRELVAGGYFEPGSDGEAAVILCGPCGTGKSHLAAGLAHALAIDHAARAWKCDPAQDRDALIAQVQKRFEWTTHADLAGQLLEARRDGRRKYGALLDELVDGRLIVVDDVMAPRSHDEAAVFAELVDYRYRELSGGVAMVVTTNLTLPELKAALGDRTFDRIREGAVLRHLDGVSYRARHGWDGEKERYEAAQTASEATT